LDIYINVIMSIIDEFDDELDTNNLDNKKPNDLNLNEVIKKLKKEMSNMNQKELQSLASQKNNLLNDNNPKDKLKEKLKAMKMARNKK